MRGLTSREDDKWFGGYVTLTVENEEVPGIKYDTRGEYSKDITRSLASKLVQCSKSDEGVIYNVCWKENKSEEHFISKHLRVLLREITPPALELSFGNRHVLSKFSRPVPNNSTRKLKDLGHNYVAYNVGTCQASCPSDNFVCPAAWVCGFTLDSLVALAGGEDMISLGLKVIADCIHRKGYKYGDLRGYEREERR